ncbi:MAG: GTP cyclohydrolase II [Acidobacteriota bacterium]|nr:GTP cyclohydrolase II [Acidobacteriota bacterium]
MTRTHRIRKPLRREPAANETEARIVAKAKFPTRFGRFTIYGIEGARKIDEAVAIQHGKLQRGKPVLVRVHSQCLTGDVFGSERCDCRAQLEFSLKRIAKAPSGIILYLAQEGRGIGLINKLRAYELQDEGLDTVEANRTLGFAADSRDYDFAAAALKALGVRSVRLLSNNPEKVSQLERNGIRVVQRVPCQPPTTKHSRAYLRTKLEKLGHLLDSP